MAAAETILFATEAQWRALLSALERDYDLYGPQAGEGEVRLDLIGANEVTLAPARMVDPLKAMLFQAREDLGAYFGAGPPAEMQPRAVVGVTGCDLASLAVLDYIFLQGDVVDPQYQRRREATLIISQDCTEPREVCFCVGVGGQPYPTAGYHVNLSRVEGGLVLEAGNDRGRAALQAADLPAATAEQVAERDHRRAEVAEKVRQQAQAFGLPVDPKRFQQQVKAGIEHPVWKREAEKCVECGACNFICPTCHCFLLSDLETTVGANSTGGRGPAPAGGGEGTPTPLNAQEQGRQGNGTRGGTPAPVGGGEGTRSVFERFKNWDACQYVGFARVAGGANPRPKRWERLRNRFDKKFDFFVTHVGAPACTGCGRCIEACPGRIDLRDILKELLHA